MCGVSDWLGPLAVKRSSCVCVGGGVDWLMSACNEEQFGGGGGGLAVSACNEEKFMCVCVLREEGCLAVSICNEEKFVCGWGVG